MDLVDKIILIFLSPSFVGILCGKCGTNGITLRPSLIFTEKHAHIFLDALEHVMKETQLIKPNKPKSGCPPAKPSCSPRKPACPSPCPPPCPPPKPSCPPPCPSPKPSCPPPKPSCPPPCPPPKPACSSPSPPKPSCSPTKPSCPSPCPPPKLGCPPPKPSCPLKPSSTSPKPQCSPAKPTPPKNSCSNSKPSYSTISNLLTMFSTEAPCPPSKPSCPPKCSPPDPCKKEKKGDTCNQKASSCPPPRPQCDPPDPCKVQKANQFSKDPCSPPPDPCEVKKKPSCPAPCPLPDPCAVNKKLFRPPRCPPPKPCGGTSDRGRLRDACKPTENRSECNPDPCFPYPPPCCGVNLNDWDLVDIEEKEYDCSRKKKKECRSQRSPLLKQSKSFEDESAKPVPIFCRKRNKSAKNKCHKSKPKGCQKRKRKPRCPRTCTKEC